DALVMFPSNDSVMRHPLPSPGFLRVRFSWFLGTVGCSDALGPCRRAWLPSLGDTRPCACLGLSLRPDAGRGPGAFGSGSPAPVFTDGTPGPFKELLLAPTSSSKCPLWKSRRLAASWSASSSAGAVAP